MTSCPPPILTKTDNPPPSPPPHLPSPRLLSLPPAVITNIFLSLSPNSHPSSPSQCHHAWIKPAFQFASSNSRLYLLYCQAMFNPALDSHHQQEFLTTDCQTNCFTTLLSGISSLTLVRRAASPIFDAEFILRRHIPTPSSHKITSTTQTFSAKNATVSITQIEQLFPISNSFPSLSTLQLTNVTSRENTHLWIPITRAWSQSLKSLSIEDTYSYFDQRSFIYFPLFRNLERLVISSRAVHWIHPLQNLTSLNELVLHNCPIHDHHVIHVLSHMTHLRVLDLTETCVTPNIVNSLPTSLVRLAAGHRDAYCGDQDKPSIIPGLPPIDVRQATLFEHVNNRNNNHLYWKKIIVIQPENLPNLKSLEWGEWTPQRQSPASLRLIITQLESLSLCGPDYDDELCDTLFTASHLKSLELYGCNVTDMTAHVISHQPLLQFVHITNCQRITPCGLMDICTGRAARSETLESVFFFGQVQSPSDALSDLLDDHPDMFSDTDVNDVNHTDLDVSLDAQS